MAASSSSAAAHDHHNNLSNPYSSTAAPPPTPSAQLPHHNHPHLSTSASMAADTLSRLLNRLGPPSLSLPARLRPSPLSSAAATSSVHPLPLISFSNPNAKELILSAASEHGFFQLADHGIASQLAHSAELESLALFDLPGDQKEMRFPRNWPLGFEAEEEGNGESFWLDDTASSSVSSLRELSRALERVGLEVVEMLARGVGFENPFKGGEDPAPFCSMMVVSESERESSRSGESEPPSGGGFYPYVVGLQYQIRRQKQYLLPGSGSGWVTVLPEAESVLVTVGDIGQVWSNGKLKNVRGRAVPVPCLDEGNDENKKKSKLAMAGRRSISMTLSLTLPLESTISPLVSEKLECDCKKKDDDEEEEDDKEGGGGIMKMKFRSIEMEDYAWKVYHEPFLFKDPLDRYRL